VEIIDPDKENESFIPKRLNPSMLAVETSRPLSCANILGKIINNDNKKIEHKTIARTLPLVTRILKRTDVFKLFSSYKFITKTKFKIKLSVQYVD